MRLTFVISSLTSGGAERVLSILANHWAGRGWQVTIITLNAKTDLPFYPLDPRITLNPLDLMAPSISPLQGLLNNFRRILALRAALRQSRPQVAVGFLGTTNILTLLAGSGLKIPLLVSERSNPAREKIGEIWGLLRDLTYSRADALVLQHSGAAHFYQQKGFHNGVVIPNPVLLPDLSGSLPSDFPAGPLVIGLGRFTAEKGFPLLVQAFGLVHSRFPEWKLVLLGDGPQRAEIMDWSARLGLEQHLFLMGNVSSPGICLSKADLFVMPSLYEGFPNALCEAMACGLPVLASNCSAGVAGIVQDGLNGLLVESGSVSALAAGMERLMSEPLLRSRLGAEARQVVELYSLEKITAMWEALFERCLSGTSPEE